MSMTYPKKQTGGTAAHGAAGLCLAISRDSGGDQGGRGRLVTIACGGGLFMFDKLPMHSTL